MYKPVTNNLTVATDKKIENSDYSTSYRTEANPDYYGGNLQRELDRCLSQRAKVGTRRYHRKDPYYPSQE